MDPITDEDDPVLALWRLENDAWIAFASGGPAGRASLSDPTPQEAMMGDEQRQALARLFAEDEAFKAAMSEATSVEDAVRVAGKFGIAATAEDFTGSGGAELGDAELGRAAGGTHNLIPGEPITMNRGFGCPGGEF